MKSRFYKRFGILLILALTVASCKKEEIASEEPAPNQPTTVTSPIGSGISISTSIGGTVVDELNSPVENAQVTIGSLSVNTNVDGQFYFPSVTVDSDRAYLTAEKSGYFIGSRAFNPETGEIHTVKIKLLPKTSIGAFNSNLGATVSASGASLTFEAGDISLQNGTPYSGTVNVYASYLDPTASDLGEIMPGDLQAKDANDNLVILQTYGMIVVELEGSNGEALNVASGQTVQLSMPVSLAQQSNAPSTIPLWHFDEANGNWIEDGSATLQGNNYVGNVSHFTFWNCDMPFSSVPFEVTFECNGDPISNLQVSMYDANSNILYGISYTNSSGQITDPIPAGIELIMVVHDQCGNEVANQNIGVNYSALQMGVISVCGQITPLQFTGTLMDCYSQPVSNGLVNVNIGGIQHIFYSDQNGVVDGTIASCSQDDLVITAFDFPNNLQSQPSVMPFSTSFDAGLITVCDSIDEFVEYTFEGTTYTYVEQGQNEVNLTKSATGDTLEIIALEQVNTNVLIAFSVVANSTGVYPNTIGGNITYTPTSCLLLWQPGQNVSAGENSIMVNITQYAPNIGDYMEGTFSGSFIDAGSIPRSVAGSFRVMRSI